MVKKIIAVIMIIGFAAAAALSVYFFFFYIDGYSRVLGAQPCTSVETIKGLFISLSDYPTEQNGTEQLEYINQALEFAEAGGFNTVILQAQSGDISLFDSALFTNISSGGESAPYLLGRACREKGMAFYITLSPLDTGFDSGCINTLCTETEKLCREISLTGIIFNADAENFTVSSNSYSLLLQSVPDNIQANLCFAYDEGFECGAVVSLLDKKPEYIFTDLSGLEKADITEILSDINSAGCKAATLFDDSGAFLSGSLLLASHSPFFGGAVFSGYNDGALPFFSRMLYTCLNTAENRELPSFIPLSADTLTVTLPIDREVTYSGEYYISGFCNENQPLFMNGENISQCVYGKNFGVFVELNIGENTFTFTQQDGSSDSVTIIRKTYSGTGSSMQYDNSKKAGAGQAVRVKNWIASVLSDPDSDSSIVETLHRGDVMLVDKTVTTVRNGKYTYAYRLSDGNYILASAVEFCAAEDAFASFTGGEVTFENGCEYLRFNGSGAPYIRSELTDSSLTFTFYDTDSLSADFPRGGTLFTSVELTDNSNGVFSLVIQLNPENPLWGYQIEKDDGGFSICLKSAPSLSQNFDKPLDGVTVMLDPGHGGTDTGAMGIGGGIGITEKVLNLAVANATAYRLEQLGATVIMTREDDSFPTLEDRNRMIFEQKPDFFLSIHHNSLAPSTDATDINRLECYYAYTGSLQFAKSLMYNISSATGRTALPPRWDYYYVTRSTVAPCVLFEYGYLVSPTEYSGCTDNAQIWAAACAAAQSITECTAQASA